MITHLRNILASAFFATAASACWAQAVTVVEYYNKTLDAYFITGRANEQQALDTVADFQRTGMTFQAVAASAAASTTPPSTRICRFYISTASPYANTHFYGREGVDCEQIRALNAAGFSWEDYDFALAQPTAGVCPAASTTIYRSFRPAAGGKTANHRYSASAASYASAAAAGYVGEQAAFCAVSATDARSDCGTFYYPVVRINYQSLSSNGVAESWSRFRANSPVVFNEKQATPIVDLPPSGLTRLTLIDDGVDTWTEFGTRNQINTGSLETYLTPPTVYPRRMTAGQVVNVSRALTNDPVQTTGAGTQTGNVTFVGRESVTIPAGTYNACKFTSEITTQYAAVGRTEINRVTTWVAPNVGIVKSSSVLRVTASTGATPTEVSTEVSATTVR
jgi:hypothetical protein